MILNQWIATLLASDVENSQQTHIAHLKRAKDIWNELRRIYNVSGKGRLTTMLQRFYGYTKGSNKSIDQMISTLKQLSDEIYDLAPEARPSEISRATIIINACQGEEYTMVKFTLGQADILTSALTVEQLRSVEQDIRKSKEGANIARGGRDKQGQRGRSQGTNKSAIECYNCGERGHYKSECINPSKNDTNKNSRLKNDRKASNKTQGQPAGRKDKAAVAAEEQDENLSEPSKERVWITLYKHKKAMGWLIDSRVTRHITPQRELFIRFTPCDKLVEFGD